MKLVALDRPGRIKSPSSTSRTTRTSQSLSLPFSILLLVSVLLRLSLTPSYSCSFALEIVDEINLLAPSLASRKVEDGADGRRVLRYRESESKEMMIERKYEKGRTD